MSVRRKPSGFTLIELIITVALAVLVAVIGVPSYGSLVDGLRLSGVTGELHQALLFARSEAAKRGRSVILESKSGTQWGSGWRVRDATTNEVVRDTPALGADFAVTGSAASLTYAPHGSPSTAVTLTICPGSGPGRRITVNALGRPAVAEAACGG